MAIFIVNEKLRRQNPGDTYVEGLWAIAQKNNVGIPEATDIALEDLRRIKSEGEILPTLLAELYLNPGDIYVYGLLGLSETRKTSLEKTLEETLVDCI